jgi:methylmalonyl-CoA mutase cobalamin-binding domain/chain
MKTALAILDEGLRKGDSSGQQNQKIMLVTVQGDVHDIGKTIVGAMMTASGFRIIDLGSDVPNEDVIKAIKEEKPDVLGLSALLTSTMEEQRNIIKMLESQGLRDSLKVIVGGAPVNQNWANSIGADGYSDSGVSAVRLVEELLK